MLIKKEKALPKTNSEPALNLKAKKANSSTIHKVDKCSNIY